MNSKASALARTIHISPLPGTWQRYNIFYWATSIANIAEALADIQMPHNTSKDPFKTTFAFLHLHSDVDIDAMIGKINELPGDIVASRRLWQGEILVEEAVEKTVENVKEAPKRPDPFLAVYTNARMLFGVPPLVNKQQ